VILRKIIKIAATRRHILGPSTPNLISAGSPLRILLLELTALSQALWLNLRGSVFKGREGEGEKEKRGEEERYGKEKGRGR